MIITHHREKLINAIIYFARNTKHCGKVKLMKLLYFLDFYHFRETGKSVTGQKYYAWQMGPVPVEIYNEISSPKNDFSAALSIKNNGEFCSITPKKNFDSKYFTKREIRILENLIYIFKEAKADDMIESSHLHNSPWDRTKKEKGMQQHIDYMLAIDCSENSLLPEDVIARLKDCEEMIKEFGIK